MLGFFVGEITPSIIEILEILNKKLLKFSYFYFNFSTFSLNPLFIIVANKGSTSGYTQSSSSSCHASFSPSSVLCWLMYCVAQTREKRNSKDTASRELIRTAKTGEEKWNNKRFVNSNWNFLLDIKLNELYYNSHSHHLLPHTIELSLLLELDWAFFMEVNKLSESFYFFRILIRVSRLDRRTDRTTMLLVAVLILFLITEFPQGILGLLSGILGKWWVCWFDTVEIKSWLLIKTFTPTQTVFLIAVTRCLVNSWICWHW